MINVNELMLNNWIVCDDFLKPVRVTAYSFKKIKEKPERNHPIKLDKDILLKAGFEEKEMKLSNVVSSYWKNHCLIWHESGEVYVWNEKQEQIDLRIVYLHQLQNLYRLFCGEDLKIELNDTSE